MNTSEIPAQSLQNLNDIVGPAPVPWWPPAPGWYVLAGLVLVLATWFIVAASRSWFRNRYRREALNELAQLRSDQSSSGWRAVPALLKRTALASFPRTRVASLSGDEWINFLCSTVNQPGMDREAGVLLERAAYGTSGFEASEIDHLFKAAETWIRRHRVSQTSHQETVAI